MFFTRLWQNLLLIIFGILLSLVLMELGLRLGGVVFLSLQEYRNVRSIIGKGEYRIMCIGESTTAFGGEDSYPAQLEKILNARHLGIRFKVINKGVPGTDVSFLVSKLSSQVDKYHPDMIITMMGINNYGFEAVKRNIPQKNGNTKESLNVLKLAQLLWRNIQVRCMLAGVNQKKPGAKPGLAAITGSAGKEEKDLREQALQYQRQGAFAQAEEMFKQIITRYPQDGWHYYELGMLYREEGKYPEAIEAFEKASGLLPGINNPSVSLGLIYRDLGEYDKAEHIFTNVIDANPCEYVNYNYLEWTYRREGRDLSRIENLYKKAIQFIPKDSRVYVRLGWYYNEQGRLAERDGAYKKALSYSVNTEASMDLGYHYVLCADYTQAESIFKNLIAMMPGYDRVYGSLAVVYNQTKQYDLMAQNYTKANAIRAQSYSNVVCYAYRKTKEIADTHRITLVCVQYPMYPLSLLQENIGTGEGIIFVDNEKSFKDGVREGGYWDYFSDMFGGEFGHCQAKGNSLLAHNIAQVIIKDVFHFR